MLGNIIVSSDINQSLLSAVIGGNASLIPQLATADVNALLNGSRPLHIAAQLGHHEVIIELLKLGASVSLTNSNGATPLQVAVATRHSFCIAPLVAAGADVNAPFKGSSPLDMAAELGDYKAISELVRLGANVSLTNSKGATPLLVAVAKRHKLCIAPLVGAGADINVQFNGSNPLDMAAELGDHEVISELVRLGANVSITNCKGATPLQVAVVLEHVLCIRPLVTAGAKINEPDPNKSGYSLLHLAVIKGSTALIQELTNLGANPNAKDIEEDTPLHLAAMDNHVNCIKLLKEKEQILTAAIVWAVHLYI